jgi:hypothetical protein
VQIIVLIPAVLAAVVAFRRSPQEAFLDVYLPVLLLLPDSYHWIAPGLPDPTFSQATILPIFAAWLSRPRAPWRFSVCDVAVLAFAVVQGISEFQNTNYKESQNLMFTMFASVIIPYVLAKGMIEPLAMRVAFARRIAILLFGVSLVSVYEFRMGATPFTMILGPFFPGQGGWVTTFRYGLARIAGPYGHAILAGVILVVGYRLQRWLERQGEWEPTFRHAPWLPVPKARAITLGIMGGAVMTLCRGPWIGAVLATGITIIGRFRNRRLAARTVFIGMLVVGVPASIALWSWASVGRAAAKTVSQETAAYRKELIDKYLDFAIDHAWLGWGKVTWPKLQTMPSIDNYYLLLALMHGFVAVGLLLFLFGFQSVRLYRFGMREPHTGSRGSLAFTFLGIFVAYAFSILTVYLGEQTVPLLFMLFGWCDAYLLFGAAQTASPAAAGPVSRPLFRRIVV